uniref:Uncharacterized protein n=1 Tax=Lepeophtheirus salmonis TaxID=72036 RepID=A0A0K2UIW7_LEPSM
MGFRRSCLYSGTLPEEMMGGHCSYPLYY